MGNKPDVRHYFAEGVTNRGYISLLPNMMSKWERTYVLMGGPGTGKSTLIKMIGLELLDRGYEVDFLRSARDPDSIAGLLLRRFRLAMLDQCEIAPLQWRAPGIIEQFFDLTGYCDLRILDQKRQSVLELEQEITRVHQQIGEILAEELGERLRQKSYTDKNKAKGRPWLPNLYPAEESKEVSPWLKAQDAIKKLQQSDVNSFFLHGMDRQGWRNLAPHYLSDYDQICLDGEETHEAMDWVFKEAEQLGQVIDIVLHPLNPDEILGIIFPERNLVIWQGAPDCLEDQGLGCPFSSKLSEALTGAQNIRDQLKSIYMSAMDFDQVDFLRNEMINSILRYIEQKHTF